MDQITQFLEESSSWEDQTIIEMINPALSSGNVESIDQNFSQKDFETFSNQDQDFS